MAKLVCSNRPNSLKLKMLGLIALGLLSILLTVGMLLLAFQASPYFAVGCLILFLLAPLRQRYFILKAGADGEDEVRQLFRKLPDGYFVLSDLMLRVQGRQSQIDHLVLCERAVFVVEVKNISGCLLGRAQDKVLRQQKKTEEKQLYNPLRQVQGHVATVRLFLSQHGLRLPVFPVVYFCNAKLRCAVDFGEKAVFCNNENGEEKLLHYLRTVSSDFGIDKKQLKKLVYTFKKAQ